jgi:hypothetical protein
LTREAGRRFGLTVGTAFLVLAAATWWFDRRAAAWVFSVAGSSLALAGLLIPTRLGPVERAWMSLAHALSRVTTPVTLGAIFLLVLLPVGVLRRLLGGNPLVHAARDDSFWKERPDGERRSKSMKRQF